MSTWCLGFVEPSQRLARPSPLLQPKWQSGWEGLSICISLVYGLLQKSKKGRTWLGSAVSQRDREEKGAVVCYGRAQEGEREAGVCVACCRWSYCYYRWSWLKIKTVNHDWPSWHKSELWCIFWWKGQRRLSIEPRRTPESSWGEGK